MKDFYNLFVKELKDIYSAEKQIIEALPLLEKGTSSPKLRRVFHQHLAETKLHLKRLEAISAEINEPLTGSPCKIVSDLIKEAHELIRSHYENSAKDAGLINIAQHIEHYEIASYGTLTSFAKRLKLEFVEKLLHDMAKEAGESDKHLTRVAEGSVFEAGINDKARKHCA